VLALIVAVTAVAGCSGGSADRANRPSGGTMATPPERTASSLARLAGAPTSWPVYHANAARSGYVAGLPPAGRLTLDWSRGLDGAVYGQPIAVGGMVIAATEHDSVYGLDRLSGRIRWRTHLGTPLPLAAQPCGDIDPLGVTSTPAYDPATGLVYVVAQVGRTGHVLAGLNPTTGRVRVRRGVPAPDRRPAFDQQRGALAAANGRIYVTFGGHFGDCGPYLGSVVGMPASGPGPIVSYLVPAASHGGIWAPAGPVIAKDGTVYVGVGNGATSPPYDFSDSVTALSPRLRRTGFFAPTTWMADNSADADLGAVAPALVGAWIVPVGKSGTGYLLRAGHLGGIGGQVARSPVCAAFGGAAVVGTTVYVPCAGGGPAAVRVLDRRLRLLWRGPGSADGSPVAGGGAIWVTATGPGILYELSARTGQASHEIRLGATLPHFASPTLSGRLVLIGTLNGVVAVAGA
jgi:polyvinyl alcohol dehydrogenase (cytochrome)